MAFRMLAQYVGIHPFSQAPSFPLLVFRQFRQALQRASCDTCPFGNEVHSNAKRSGKRETFSACFCAHLIRFFFNFQPHVSLTLRLFINGDSGQISKRFQNSLGPIHEMLANDSPWLCADNLRRAASSIDRLMLDLLGSKLESLMGQITF